jgi:acetylornithine aminotransferase
MTAELLAHADQVLALTYARFPLVFTKGKGSTLFDSSGRSYLDFVAGIAVCNLGHAHRKLGKTLADQAGSLWHVSNLYYTTPQIELADWLVKHSFADRVFFGNSGAEANEAAIKLARRYFSERNEAGRFRIITMERSFHGRTMATLSATGQDKIKKGFDPVLEGFDYVSFNDPAELRSKIGSDTCAVLVEPVQGEGGVRCPDADYFKAVREICNETGVLLIFDEIQTGMGRTGKFFAYEHFDIEPDIMTLAKALANGLPIGAMLARESIATAFNAGSHASTFGGTPIVTSVAAQVCRMLVDEGIVENARVMGQYFRDRLLELKARHTIVDDVRGIGLLLGMKLKSEGAPLVKECMQRGFLINCIQDNILRFVPPLIITRAEIDKLIQCLDDVMAHAK